MPDQEKKKLDLQRREMPKQSPVVRSQNFSEVALGYSEKTAVEEAMRCLQCKKPKCVLQCPVEIDIPGFIKCIAEHDFAKGVQVLKDKNLLHQSDGETGGEMVKLNLELGYTTYPNHKT